MALRYLASRIGVPALRRASGSRLAQPAGTPRRLFSSSHQGGQDNGARKPMTDADVARLQAEFAAKCEAVREAMGKEADSRSLLRAGIAGVGMALLTIWHSTYTEIQRGKAFEAMNNQLIQKYREAKAFEAMNKSC